MCTFCLSSLNVEFQCMPCQKAVWEEAMPDTPHCPFPRPLGHTNEPVCYIAESGGGVSGAWRLYGFSGEQAFLAAFMKLLGKSVATGWGSGELLPHKAISAICSVPAQAVQWAPGVCKQQPCAGDAEEEAHGEGGARRPREHCFGPAARGLQHPWGQHHKRWLLPELETQLGLFSAA